jgi:hypothetical protein
VKPHNESPITLLCETRLFEQGDDVIEIVRKGTLALVFVEVHAKNAIDAFCLFAPGINEGFPQRHHFRVAIGQSLLARSGLHAQIRILLDFVIEAHIQGELLISPQLIGRQQLAEIRSVVTVVVDPDTSVSEKCMDAIDGVSNRGGTQMRDRKRTSEIR